MSRPPVQDWAHLERLARYLLPRARGGVPLEGGTGGGILVSTDSDWGLVRSTRSSTTGGVLSVGGRVVNNLNSTQGRVALSSAEAEVYGIRHCTGRPKGVGPWQVLHDLGWDGGLRRDPLRRIGGL